MAAQGRAKGICPECGRTISGRATGWRVVPCIRG